MICVCGRQHCLFADLFNHVGHCVNTKGVLFVSDGLHGAVCFGPVASRELKENFTLWIQLGQIQPQSSIAIGIAVFLCFGHLDKAFLFCSDSLIRLFFYVSLYNIIKNLETAVKRGRLLGHNGALSLNFLRFSQVKRLTCALYICTIIMHAPYLCFVHCGVIQNSV